MALYAVREPLSHQYSTARGSSRRHKKGSLLGMGHYLLEGPAEPVTACMVMYLEVIQEKVISEMRMMSL